MTHFPTDFRCLPTPSGVRVTDSPPIGLEGRAATGSGKDGTLSRGTARGIDKMTLAGALMLMAAITMSSPPAAAAADQANPSTSPGAGQMRMMAVTLVTADLERAQRFYTDGLGLTAVRRNETAQHIELPLQFPGGGAIVMLLLPKKKGAQSGAAHSAKLIFDVPDLSVVQARLTAAGYALSGPIVEIAKFGVRVAHVTDPDGNDIELVQHSPGKP
jgi:predicted enzyme related to lactoylglutathione lyase